MFRGREGNGAHFLVPNKKLIDENFFARVIIQCYKFGIAIFQII
jgi:hypothetical protein